MNIDALRWFHFIRPEYLWLFVPFTILIYLNWKRTEKKNQWLAAIPPHLLAVLQIGAKGWRRQLPIKLLLVVGSLIIVVLAGPTWRTEPSPFSEDQSDLIVVLDVSNSMEQQDVTPSRLSLAKYKILDLIEARDGGRNGLIVYSGSAHIAMPLTQDSQVFAPLLEAISNKVMPREGKYLHRTLPLIEEMARTSTAVNVLVLTDAVDQQGRDEFNRYASKHQYNWLILGMGNENVASDIAYEKQSLVLFSDDVGGAMRSVTTDNSDVVWLAKRIEQHMHIDDNEFSPWVDDGYYLIFVIAAFALLWFRKGWVVQWCLVVMLTGGTIFPSQVEAKEWQFIDLWLTADQQGQRLFDDGHYGDAAAKFESNLWKAMSYYNNGDYELAHEYFLRVDSFDARFGAAAALAHQREYVAARKLYGEIIEQSPDFPGAQENYQLLDQVIQYLNEYSKSQNSSAELQQSKELADAPQTSEGAETQVSSDQIITEELNAEDILADPELSEKWMRRVEQDLAPFLQTKFILQLNQEGAGKVEGL